jgi:hypothetical protein
MIDLVDSIMAYESGELSLEGGVELFQALIDDGTVWRLQGHYSRVAMDLIERGYCHATTPEESSE